MSVTASKTHSRQRGASAIIIAASMLLLLGMAAIGIDAGAGFNERRGNQTAADVSVLAGAIDHLDLGRCFGDGSTLVEADGGCNRALEYARDNLTASFTDTEWVALWRDCRDPNKPAAFGPLPVASSYAGSGFVGFRGGSVSPIANHLDCISVSFNEVRVRIPDQLTQTTFGQMAGVAELTTSAFAQAGRFTSPGAEPIIPFGITANVSGESCLLQPPSGVAEHPCDGGETGNFGAILTQLWGSHTSIQNCSNSSWPPALSSVRFQIANGMDHPLDVVDDFTGFPVDANAFDAAVRNSAGQTANPSIDERTVNDRCIYNAAGEAITWDSTVGASSAVDTGPINTLRVDTGASASAETLQGFITGTAADFTGQAVDPSSVVPRLKLGPTCTGTESYPELCLNLGGEGQHRVDNRRLWDFLDGAVDPSSYVDPADGVTTCDAYDTNSAPTPTTIDSVGEMDCVLRAGPSAAIFTEDITSSRRFVWVPEFYYPSWGTGTGWQPIKNFKVAYIQNFWFNSSGPTAHKWEAGEDPGIINLTNPNKLQAVSAFLIPDSAVPASVLAGCPTCVGAAAETELTR